MRYVAILPLLILLMASCQKEVSADKSAQTFKSLSEFFSQNREVTQAVTISGQSGGTFQGSRGARFVIGANSFVDKNGTPVTGEVKLEILEVYTPADMILTNLTTMSNGQPLESGGEFLIEATYKGEEVKLAPGRYIAINLPGKDLDGMQVFNGQVNTAGEVNWVVNTGGNNWVVRDSSNSGSNYAYTLFCDSIQFINCDKLINDPKISCSFNPVNSPRHDSTYIYVHLTGRNSVVNVFNYTTQKFESDWLIASPVTIVGVCYANGQLYSSITNATLAHNSTYNLNFTTTTMDKLKDQLKQLK
jgi:hypothetical protein